MFNNLSNIAYIDGQNIEKSLEKLGFEIDWAKVYIFLTTHKVYPCSRVICYFKYSYSIDRNKFFEKLKLIGFEVYLSNFCGNDKINVDADIIVKAMEEYYEVGKFNLILLSGDGDFVPVVKFFERKQCKVWIIAGADINLSDSLKIKYKYRDKSTGRKITKLRSFGTIFENHKELILEKSISSQENTTLTDG
jgi:uncharacterized LabA/DUF88 family protein